MLARNEPLKLGIPNSRQVWMREYWDRYIRSEEHYHKVMDYIHSNPVKAGLCATAEDWIWSGVKPKNADVDIGVPR